MKYNVTLKATLSHGAFYWVTQVEALSEEEAVVAAENLFEAQMAQAKDWAFDDYDVEAG